MGKIGCIIFGTSLFVVMQKEWDEENGNEEKYKFGLRESGDFSYIRKLWKTNHFTLVNSLEEGLFSFKGQEHYDIPEAVIRINSVLNWLERTKNILPPFNSLDQPDYVNYKNNKLKTFIMIHSPLLSTRET